MKNDMSKNAMIDDLNPRGEDKTKVVKRILLGVEGINSVKLTDLSKDCIHYCYINDTAFVAMIKDGDTISEMANKIYMEYQNRKRDNKFVIDVGFADIIMKYNDEVRKLCTL